MQGHSTLSQTLTGTLPPIASTHRTIRLSVRPARVAVLVQEVPRWRERTMRVIEALSRTWGGSAAILVPLVGEKRDMVPDAFWPLLEAYDPDWLSVYLQNLRGVQLEDPRAFERYVQQEAEAFAASAQMSAERARAQIFADDRIREASAPIELASATSERIARTLAAFAEHRVHEHIFTADAETTRPLVDMRHVVPAEGRRTINLLNMTLLPLRSQLLLAMRLGAAAPGYEAVLNELDVPVMNDRAELPDLPVLIDLAYRGAVPPHAWSLHRALRGASGIPDPTWRHETYAAESPFGWTETGCSWFQMFARSRADEAPFVVVAGDTFVDLCFAYSLDRLTRRAIWMPVSAGEGEDEAETILEAASDFLVDAPRRSDARMHLTSTSLAQQALETLRDGMREVQRGQRARADMDDVEVGPVRGDDVRVVHPMRLLDRDASDQARLEPFVAGAMVGTLTTPVPSAAFREPAAVQWHVDALVDNTRLPTRAVVAPLLTVTAAFAERVRSSRDGTSYVSESFGFIPAGARLDQRLARIRLRMPEPVEIFRALLAREGMRAELSQAGVYTSAAMDLFGGFDPLVSAFTDASTAVVLEAFRNPHPLPRSHDEDAGVGIYLSPLQRRFVSLPDLAKRSTVAVGDTRDVLDTYVARGILYRGVILGCPRCRYVGWYRAGEFAQSFSCTRCRTTSALARERWRHPEDEPEWRYELDELVYQAVMQNARAPILALDALKKSAPLGFQFSPELEVYETAADRPFAELDIWALVDGRIVVGEAKTIDRLADRGERELVSTFVRVADVLTADELVIATTQPTLRDGTRALLHDALRGHRTRLRVLAGLG